MTTATKSSRLFKSDALEMLTHVHPITPLVMWVPVIFYVLHRSIYTDHIAGKAFAIFAVAGFVIWTLMEYLLHRHVFHYEAKTTFGKRLVFMFHGIHHDEPGDKTRLVMPPLPAIFISLPFYFGFQALIGEVYYKPFFAFFLIGYLCYDYTHYAVHHFTPKTAWGKHAKQYHMLHHFASHDRRFGVSSPFWDFVFGTGPEKKKT